MATQLKLRRGTTAEHASFTGAEGEITLDTTKDTIVVHDNYTAGGRPLLREDLNNLANNSIGVGKISKGSATAGQVLRVNAAGTGMALETPMMHQGDFVGVHQWTTGPHNASGTLNWGNSPSNGTPSSAVQAAAGIVRGASSSTFAWNGSTFTAYDPGVYFIYATVIPHNSGSSISIYINYNGSGVTDNRSGGNSNHGNAHTQALVNMSANDYITVSCNTAMHNGLYGNIMIYKMANGF